MQIDRVYYPVKTLGYGDRIGIWTIGCRHHCTNCSNPELWKTNEKKNIDVSKIINCIKNVPDADGVTITGGDPFEQPDELFQLVKELKELGYEDILVYSGYTYEELKCKGQIFNDILDIIGILVDGKYVDVLNDNLSFRGSSNQRIIILNQKLGDRYKGAETWTRQSQILVNDGKIQAIGLPMK